MRFIPNSEKEKREMLKEIGVNNVKELFADVPKKVLIEREMNLQPALNERELRKEIESIAALNKTAKQLQLFIGAGCYNHFIPATVAAITSRSEFYTAYTPYQPEISQGILQAIFEWQTYICLLTGMDVANASMYDGASATAEAMVMAKNFTGRKEVLVAKSLNPEYKAVVETYANAGGLQLREIETKDLVDAIDEETACFIVQQPNFFGCIEKLSEIGKAVHAKEALLVVAIAEAMSLPFIGEPAESGADIVAADVQSFGNAMNFGGPAAGVIACRQQFLRQIPGRLVGKTADADGKEGFILTLQAREQHIRREKAGSNICTNQSLGALAATVFLATIGKKGLKEVAGENHANALYLAEKLQTIGFEFPFGKNFFNEFVAKKKDIKKIREKLLQKNIVFGLLLEENFPELRDCVLLAATEMNSKWEIDKLAAELEALQ